MPILNFTFEELPLIIDAGFEAGLVNGSADVSYLGDDCTDWCIHNIVLDGNKAVHHTEHAKAVARLTGRPLPRFETQPVPLERQNHLYRMIYDRLENEWKVAVTEAVREAMHADIEAARLARHRRVAAR